MNGASERQPKKKPVPLSFSFFSLLTIRNIQALKLQGKIECKEEESVSFEKRKMGVKQVTTEVQLLIHFTDAMCEVEKE